MTDAPSWPPCFFDLTDPDGPGVAPSVIVPILIGYFAHETTHTPDWRIDQRGGSLISLAANSTSKDEARIGFAASGAEGVIRLVREQSGWLGIEVTLNGAEVFRAWLDQPYEEYDLWPVGAAKSAEAPGRMGKKRNWLSLNTDAWPALKPLANGGPWLNLHAMDYTTIYVRLLNQGPDDWRPVQAVPADEGFELIAPEGYDPGLETWQFAPGSIVRCEMQRRWDDDLVVAVELLKESRD